MPCSNWYRKYAPGDITLEQLETEAREAKRGLWLTSSGAAVGVGEEVAGSRRVLAVTPPLLRGSSMLNCSAHGHDPIGSRRLDFIPLAA